MTKTEFRNNPLSVPDFKIKDEFKDLDVFDAYKAVYIDKKDIIEWLPEPWYKKFFRFLRGY